MSKKRQRPMIKRDDPDECKAKPAVDSFSEYREKLRKIMQEGGASLLARHKHAHESPKERIEATEKARKVAKEVVWEQKFPTPRSRSKEMSRRRRLGIEREAEKTKPKR